MNRVALFVSIAAIGVGRISSAQPQSSSVDLVIKPGTPLRVVLDERLTVKREGQPVNGTLAESIYVYDRIVVPAGVRVLGHVVRFEQAPRVDRVRAMLGGSFSTLRHVIVQFDTVVMEDGREVPIETIVTGTPARMRREVAGAGKTPEAAEPDGVVDAAKARARAGIQQARDEIKQRKDAAIAAIREPGKMDRLKEAAINRLPYHPQFVGKGTVYNAHLIGTVPIGTVTPAVVSPDARPEPRSVLKARLITALDSTRTPRGTAVEAVVTQPVYSADHQLVLAEGSLLQGEVTFTKNARYFRRNGQLRFLFESVRPPSQEPRPLLASLHSVETSSGDHVALDDEGGASVTNPKTRFIAPTLAILAMSRTADAGERRIDGDADDTVGGAAASGNIGSGGVGGFIGFGLIGTALSMISHPAALAFGALGVARSVYSSVIAKGQEVTFAADTPIEVQLAAAPLPAQR
jgi:hypothetical protein